LNELQTGIVYCCERGRHFILAHRLYEWKKAVKADHASDSLA
jgi:hypothetical protein